MLIPYAFFDPPEVLDASVTPIPSASDDPLQVIADSGKRFGVGIVYSDSTNMPIGVYVGAYGQEKLVCIIGNGTTSQSGGLFPTHSRVSLRAMNHAAIVSGQVIAALVVRGPGGWA